MSGTSNGSRIMKPTLLSVFAAFPLGPHAGLRAAEAPAGNNYVYKHSGGQPTAF